MSEKPSGHKDIPGDKIELQRILEEELNALGEELDEMTEGAERRLLPGGGWTGSGN